MAAILNTICPR